MAAPRRVIAFADSNDAHLPFVQRHLSSPLLIIDPQKVLAGALLSYRYKSGTTTIVYDDIPLDAHTVAGIWLRHPVAVEPSQVAVEEAYRGYAASAINELITLFEGAFKPSLWISDPSAVRQAGNKLRQLRLAQKLGFQVPDTLATSDQAAARKFIDQQKNVIVKRLAQVMPRVNGVQKMQFATKFSSDAPPDLSGLSLAPSFFQEAIETKADLRVTVVGTDIFAARISAPNQKMDSVIRDWRPGQFDNSLTIETYTMPKAIADLCRQHVHQLGLSYGAIDLVEDIHGNVWFIENNPIGQWAFIEQETGMEIGKKLARLLSK